MPGPPGFSGDDGDPGIMGPPGLTGGQGPTGATGNMGDDEVELLSYLNARISFLEEALRVFYGPNDILVPPQVTLLRPVEQTITGINRKGNNYAA
jgi:hypothetical protein